MTPGEFEGKIVLVTGASRGIGKSIAEQFAAHGARVALHFNAHRSLAERVRASLPGGPHILLQADLTKPDSAREAIETVLRETGGLDILINNAGIYELHSPAQDDFSLWKEAWDRTIAVNLTAPAHLSYWAVQQMLRQSGGTIVNISSRGAFRGEPHAPAYGAAKAGLNALGQSMAKALAPRNIFVYTVAPGWVDTDMASPSMSGPDADSVKAQSPLNRLGRPEEIARIVLFLASEQSQYMTGCIIDANGASYLRT
jgi:3-oxoacyl-[acyl-carrier protein] reductase